jgi:hypothetical protein
MKITIVTNVRFAYLREIKELKNSGGKTPLILTSVLDGGEYSTSSSSHLETWHPNLWMLCGSQKRSEYSRKEESYCHYLDLNP